MFPQYCLERWTGRCVLFAVAVFLSSSLIGCTISRNPVSGDRRLYGYSWDKEVQIGRQADEEIIAQYGIYEEDKLNAYVKRVGEEVLAESHLRRSTTPEKFRETPFTFRVLDSPVVNAFALPGGFVYVTRGLLAHLQNEAQLAMVLGHEVAHVAARHASQRALANRLSTVGLIGGAVLGQQVFGMSAGDILDLGGAATQLLLLSYSREDERESDRLGMEYAARAGYAPEEGAGFFESLERMEPEEGGLPSFLATHPDPGERVKNIRTMADKWHTPEKTLAVHHERYFDRLEGLVLGTDPRQGLVRNDVFYHPGFEFQFPLPPNWKVQNQPTYVAAIQPDQQAVILFEIVDEAGSLEEAANRLVQQGGWGISERQHIDINGYPALQLIAQTQSQGRLYRSLITYIEYRDHIYRMLGYTAAGAFGRYFQDFKESARGFARLTDQRILDIQPVRIDIEPVEASRTLQDFFPDEIPGEMSTEELAILNQRHLADTLEPGTLIKIPVRR